MDRLNRAIAAVGGRQPVRFLAVGLANTALCYGLYLIALRLGIEYRAAILVALCIGVLVGFLSQGRLTFEARLKNRFGLFAAVWALLYFANISLIAALKTVGVPPAWGGLAALPLITAASFLLQRHVVFAEPRRTMTQILLGGSLLALAVLRFNMLFAFEINWDEFLNLSMVYAYQGGELREVLQTVFVHLFTWLPNVSGNEADQVIAGRGLIFLFGLVTSLAIYRVARRFMAAEPALFAVLAYNAFTFVFEHGGSLRTDPLATATMMVAVWIGVDRIWNWRRAIALGLLVGLSGALTIKAVFLVPVIALVLLTRCVYGSNRRREAALLLTAGGVALGTLAGVLAVHSSTLSNVASATDFVARTSGATLGNFDYEMTLRYLKRGVRDNAIFFALFAVGLARVALMLRQPGQRQEALMLGAMSLTLLSLPVYRDVYPYYYVMMLAPLAVIAGLGFERALAIRVRFVSAVIVVLLAVSTGLLYFVSIQRSPARQREVLAVVHQLYPAPVTYIDGVSMVSSFPKRGPFISRWGMSDYRAAGKPVMAAIIENDRPEFLLANRWQLDREVADDPEGKSAAFALLPEDRAALQSAYVQYWGPIYVPGVQVSVGTGDIQVLLPGAYRLEGGTVQIGALKLNRGETVKLERGRYATVSQASATLIRDLPPAPTHSAPNKLFGAF